MSAPLTFDQRVAMQLGQMMMEVLRHETINESLASQLASVHRQQAADLEMHNYEKPPEVVSAP